MNQILQRLVSAEHIAGNLSIQLLRKPNPLDPQVVSAGLGSLRDHHSASAQEGGVVRMPPGPPNAWVLVLWLTKPKVIWET